MAIPKTLKEAVYFVIKQNKEVGYILHRFISITKDGNAEDLEHKIRKLVLKSKLTQFIEKAIDKYGEVLTIEDLITLKDNHFGFSQDVILQAKARSEWFNTKRKTNNEWIGKFIE